MSLKYVLEYDVYKMALLDSCKETVNRIRQWLKDPISLTSFTNCVLKLCRKYCIRLNTTALNIDYWNRYLVDNDLVINAILDFKRGGCVSFKLGQDDPYLEHHFRLLVCDL